MSDLVGNPEDRFSHNEAQFLTSIMGCNSVTNFQKMTVNNTNIDLVNVDVYTKVGQILFISSQCTEQKRISDNYQGPELCYKFAKNN